MASADDILDGLEMYASRAGDWSTEETAKDMLAVITEIAKKAGVSQKTLENTAKKFEKPSANINEFSKQNKTYQSKISVTVQELNNSLGLGKTKFGSMLGNVDNLGNSIRSGTGLFSKLNPVMLGLTGVFVAVTAAVSTLVEYIMDSVNVYMRLRDVGITFAGGLVEMRYAAANASMGFEEFSKTLAENSKVITAFGGDGARQFSILSKAARDTATMQRGLAFTTEQVNEYLLDYLEVQRQTGLLDRLSAGETARRTSDYLESLDMFSQALGKSRSELAESSKSMTEGIRIQAGLRAMPKEIRDTVMDNLKRAGPAFDAIGPEFGEMVKEMIATGGRPVSEAAKMFIAASPELGSQVMALADRMGKTRLSNEDFREEMIKLKKNVGPVADDMSQLVAQLGESQPAFASFMGSLLNIERMKIGGKGEVDPLVRLMLKLGETMKSITGAFDSMKASIFENLEGPLEQFATWMNTKVLPGLKTFFDEIIGIFQGEGDFGDKLVNAFSHVFDRLAETLGPILSDMITFMVDSVLRSLHIETDAMEQRKKFREKEKEIQSGKSMSAEEFKAMARDLMIDVRDGDVSKADANKMMQKVRDAQSELLKRQGDGFNPVGNMNAYNENIYANPNTQQSSMRIGRRVTRTGPSFAHAGINNAIPKQQNTQMPKVTPTKPDIKEEENGFGSTLINKISELIDVSNANLTQNAALARKQKRATDKAGEKVEGSF